MRVYSDPASERHVNHLARVEAPERFPAALAGAEEAERGGVPVEWCSCEAAGEDTLARVHARAYLDHLQDLCARGGGYLSLDTALDAHSWEVAALASGAAVAAVESALSGEAAFAITRPPGHHAGRATGVGFCLLNRAAVAAEHARSRGVGRVAILDWDVHHGNGTQDIFYDDGEVLYLSVHQSPFYPGTGRVDEVGEGQGRGFTVNVPLPARSGEDVYAAAFAGVFLPVLREFDPALILISAGYDAHKNDPLGGMSLEASSFGRFAAWLSSLAREIGASPPALVLEGGYNLEALREAVAATIRGSRSPEIPLWSTRLTRGPSKPPGRSWPLSGRASGRMSAVEGPGDPKSIPDRRELLARLRDPQPRDTTLPAEADLYLRRNPDDEEVKEARERLPALDESE